MSSGAERRLTKELNDLKAKKPNGFTLHPEVVGNNEDIFHWIAVLDGPAGSPYEGGHIKVNINIPAQYPNKPPFVNFDPAVYHPNVEPKSGQPCLDILREKWTPPIFLRKICEALISLLQNPAPEHAVDDCDAANDFKTNKNEYIRKAKEWTKANDFKEK